MVQFKKFFIAVLVVGFTIGSFAFAQSSSVSLVGKLIDAEGRAVKDTGARIVAFREGELVREAAVAGDGRYELPLTPGTWIMFVNVKQGMGFFAPTPKRINIPEKVGTYVWNPMLGRASGIIVGSLRNESGNRLGRAFINIIDLVTGKISSSEEAAEGSYGIPVAKGTYSIEAFSSDGEVVNPTAEQRTVNDGFADLKMVFRQSDGIISGDIGGVPAGAKVSVAAWSDGGHQSEVNAEPVESGYRYLMRIKRNDVWHIRAAAAGTNGKIYESIEYVVIMGDSALKTQNFLLLPSASPALPSEKAQVVSGSSGGSVVLGNGMVVSVPRRAGADSDLTVTVTPSFIASPKQNIIGPVYRVSASGRDGTTLENIDSGVVVGIPYTDADLSRASVKSVKRLGISFWDEIARSWRSIPHSFVDENKKIVYGYTEHLALLGVGRGGAEASFPSGETGEAGLQEETINLNPVNASGGGSVQSEVPVATQSITSPSNVSVVATQAGFLSVRWFDFILRNGEVHDIERALGTNQEFVLIAQNVQSPYLDNTVQAGATYRYRVVSRDPSGITAPSISEIGTAPSDAKAPTVTVITSVIQERNAAVSVASDEQAIIAVRCLPTGVTGSAIEILLTNLVQAAIVPLTGLNAGTDYNCDVTGTDASGNTSSVAKAVFKTLGVATQTTQPAPPPPTQPVVQPNPQPTSPASQFNFVRNLALGSTGADVRALQQVLVRTGDLRVTTTTQFFGSATRAALISFQIRNGLPGTGFFGAQTRARIASGNFQ